MKDMLGKNPQHLEDAKKIADSVTDPKVKITLNAIVDDEIRHHKLFQTLKEAVMEKETIEEEDMWNRMWDPEIWMEEEL